MSVVLFSEYWYHEMIDQVEGSFPETASPDAVVIGKSLLTGFAMVAQAIDHSIGGNSSDIRRDTLANQLGRLADALQQFADAADATTDA